MEISSILKFMMKKKIAIIFVIWILLSVSVSSINAFEISGNISNDNVLNGSRLKNSGEPFDGYILFTPWLGKITYLIDNKGVVVHKWSSNHIRGIPVYLLKNGSLLRADSAGIITPLKFFFTGGCTGRVEMFNWKGELIWTFKYVSNKYCIHNDIEPLPNGNILMLVWDYKTRAEIIQAGIDPVNLSLSGSLMIDRIIEVQPIFPEGGNIVWEWRLWDHLIQDFDSSKDNYGNVSQHPELVDINSKGRKLEYSKSTPFTQKSTDFSHFNAIDYNEKLDQILVGSRYLNEVFIIDHSTTTEEAKGHTGGKSGRGGDILYRWGNPLNYQRGDKNDQKFFSIHDARWVESGYPGEGDITIFDNGCDRSNIKYSSVLEITPPAVNETGNYYIDPGCAYGPDEPVWTYTAKNPTDFYSFMMSGAQRLPNGNTLICSGVQYRFFAVTPEKETIWEYYNLRPLPIFHLNYVFKTQYYPKDYLNFDVNNGVAEIK